MPLFFFFLQYKLVETAISFMHASHSLRLRTLR
jgi:hypothetical protein